MPHCRSRTRGDRAPQVGEDQALVEAPWTAVVERRAGPVGTQGCAVEGSARVSAGRSTRDRIYGAAARACTGRDYASKGAEH